MSNTIDILSAIEEQESRNVKQLAKRFEIPLEQLKQIVTNLCEHNLIEYNPRTGNVTLPTWLMKINREIEAVKPAVGEILLPKYQEMKLQDITLGNYTKNDLELKIRFKGKQKEIAICDIS
jgi:DNA-binding MarR family transcriptional regulator